jgi:thiol-disulfide isomerase/thioredoxin
MNKKKPESNMTLKSATKKTSFLILVFCFLFLFAIDGCRKSNPSKPETPAPDSTVQKPPAPAPAKTPVISNSLGKIITNRNGWNPILANFYGKGMPDFKVTDINGKEYSLADCRGKNVLVVFWATWCQPCLMEIPYLIALRDIMGEDKLTIWAISNEPAEVVKAMTKKKNINYTVISYRGVLPSPFSSIRAYPSAFFIRPDGTLKLATEGGAYLGEMKSIILAE